MIKFLCPICKHRLGIFFLVFKRNRYMLKCPHCKKDFRYMWVQLINAANNRVCSQSVVETILIRRSLYICLIFFPCIIVLILTYMLIMIKG
jgi:hypothetical protein